MKTYRTLMPAILFYTLSSSAEPVDWANINQGDWRFGNGFSFDYVNYAAQSTKTAYSLSTSLNYFVADLREIGAGFNFEKTWDGDKPVTLGLFASQHWVVGRQATFAASPFVRIGLSDDSYKSALGVLGEYNYFIDSSTAFGPYLDLSHTWSQRSSYNRYRITVGLSFSRYFSMKTP